jgi:hypothetical protein
LLPGTWANKPNLAGRGWNMIALRFAQPAEAAFVQVVQLDFFARFDGGAGRIKWPHVSINTLEK